MGTELAVRDAGVMSLAPVVTSEQLDLVKRTIAPDATPDELQLFCYDCARQGVHPLDRMIHFTKRGKGGKYTPITSIDFMRQRAADSGEYAGNDDAVFSGTPGTDDFAATATVWRMVAGQRCAFSATARWNEYKPTPGPSGNADLMWKKLEHGMLAKCAEALALRKAFPKQTAKLYEWAEMAQAGVSDNAPPAAPVSRPRATATPTPAAATPRAVTPPKAAIVPPAAQKPVAAPVAQANAPGAAQAFLKNAMAPEDGPQDAIEALPIDPDGVAVVNVSVRTGKSSRGEWKLFIIKTSDGNEYTTFDEAIADKLAAVTGTGALVGIDSISETVKMKNGTTAERRKITAVSGC